MSTEGSSAQPPPPGNAKPNAPKPSASITSSFINKSGKPAAAPKAVRRRRPGAGAAAATPQPSQPPTSTAESQAEAQPDTTPALESQPVAPLPTPAATQETASHDVPQTKQPVSAPSITVTEPSAATETPSTVVEPPPTPAPTSVDSAPQQEKAIEPVPGAPSPDTRARPAEEPESGKSPKRRGIDHSEPTEEALPIPDVTTTSPAPGAREDADLLQPTESTPPARQPTPEQPANDAPLPETEPTATGETSAGAQRTVNEETRAAEPSEVRSPAKQTRPKRRRFPWATVNAPQDNDDEPVAATAGARRAKVKGRRKAATTANAEVEEGGEDEETLAAPKRPSAKARGKQKAVEADAEQAAEEDVADVEAGQRPGRKPRRPRKAKGKKSTVEEDEEDAEAGEAEEAESGRRKRKRRKKNAGQAEGAAEEEGERQTRRKGRPPRQPTPSDAEDEVIDPNDTFMDSLASRNIRVGKLSTREKRMREINWAEVKQRKREEEMMLVNGRRKDRDEVNRQLDEAGEARNETTQPQASGPQLREVDGQIVLVHDSGTINREADADREIEQMEVLQEDDLTNRITQSSFLRNNKRFPNEFLLPGQGKRWKFNDTDDFYKALAMFGTDFMMISTLFPGTSRRSIKTKFVREERRNPDEIKKILHGQMNSDWNQYLAKSGRKDDSFLDPDEIMRQLEEERAQMEIQIEAARAEAEEERRQRRLAGVDSEEEAGDKENGKGRKKKKGKGKAAKQVAFEAEEGVEILGEIDEAEGWGRE